jgi:hydroxypyruvate reductase
VISGGEPVVHLAETDLPRKGGRNQELVLAACQELWDDGAERLAILSGGTDGEDGPTNAAGAVLDASVVDKAKRLGLLPSEFLAINNSYEFFDRAGGLLKTGPTHTNVMDLRVAVIGS